MYYHQAVTATQPEAQPLSQPQQQTVRSASHKEQLIQRISIEMKPECSTLSAYSVVLSWLKDPSNPAFPTQDFAKAISHDIQGHHVLLHHVNHLISVWDQSWPSVRLKRRRLYASDLKPRLAKDLNQFAKLIQFTESKTGLFKDQVSHHRKLSDYDRSIMANLVHQAYETLSHLVSKIESLPEDDYGIEEAVRNEILDQDHRRRRRRTQATQWTLDHIDRPKLTLRIGEQEARQISFIKPTGSPTLVTCWKSRCVQCQQQPCTCCEDKHTPPGRTDSVICMATMS